MTTNASQEAVETGEQYSLAKILGIWVAAAAPMAILSWVVQPALAPDVEADPMGAGSTRVILMTVGLVWQFVLAMIIVYREEGNLRWATIRRRFWLNAPRDPKTGEPRRRLWLWVIPFIVLFFVNAMSVDRVLIDLWLRVFPFLAPPPGYDPGLLFASPEARAQLVGAWGFLGLFLLMAVFNTVLGEEFLFRGALLPKMNGVFGKWDWVANGVLMGAYHWHQPWTLPANILGATLLFALPAKRFRSTWLAIIVHSVQYVLFLPMILALVLGLG